MADVLVDSSVWIEFFRSGEGPVSDRLAALLDEERVALTGVVELELLQGARPRERRTLEELLGALAYVESERADFVLAGEWLGDLRRRGVTIPATDGLVAAIAHRRGLLLFATDRHFDALPELRRLDP